MIHRSLRVFILFCLAGMLALSCSLPGSGSVSEEEAAETVQSEPLAAATATQTEVVPTEMQTSAPTPTTAPTVLQAQSASGDEIIRQWAVAADASSSYGVGAGNWSPEDALGAPDTGGCYDDPYAWASAASDGVDWLEVYYAQAVIATEINIYENCYPDQVVKVELIDTEGFYWQVYESEPVQTSECPLTLHIEVGENYLTAVGLRITVDQSVLGTSWTEIDAVELVGYALYGTDTGYELTGTGSSNYEYIVTGCQEAYVSGTLVEDNSIPIMYSLILTDENNTNALILYLPRDLPDEYFEPLVAYSPGSPTAPTALLYLEPATFHAQSGLYYVYSVADGRISGNLEFVAVNEQDPSCEIMVNLNFDQLPLPD